LAKGKDDCGDAGSVSIQAPRCTMPYLIVFLLVCLLGLVVSCVIT